MPNERLGAFLGLKDLPDGAEIKGAIARLLGYEREQTDLLKKLVGGATGQPNYMEMVDGVAASGVGDYSVTSRLIPLGKRFIVYRMAIITPGSTFSYAKMYTSPGGGSTDNTSFRATANDSSNSKSYESPFGIVVHGGHAITTVFSVSAATQCTVRYEGELFTEPVRETTKTD